MNIPIGGDHHVGQLRNDVDDIYDLLGHLQGTVDGHTATLAEHTLKLDEIIDLLHSK